MIEIGALYVMDCAKTRHCKIVVDIPNRIASIVSIRNIIRFEELFAEYGPGYGF